jgi:MoaD family protein
MRVHFFASLRELAGGASVEVGLEPGSSAQRLLERVVEGCPALEPVLLDEQGQLLPHMKMFVNGREVVYLEGGLGHILEPTDRVDIFPPVGGG